MNNVLAGVTLVVIASLPVSCSGASNSQSQAEAVLGEACRRLEDAESHQITLLFQRREGGQQSTGTAF